MKFIFLLFSFLLHVALFGQFGNGSDGIPVIGSNTIVNSYKKIQSTSGATFTLLNTSAFSLSSGNVVLVINMLTGEYELRNVVSVSGTDVNLAAGTISNTVFANYSQMIKVPQFSNVSISTGNSITCPAWDGETGGVICFLVSNILSLDAGEIDASNKGFFGGNGGFGGTGGLGGLGGFSGSNTSSSGLYGMGGSGINGAGNGGAYGDLGTNGTNGSLAFFNSTTTILPCGNSIASCNNTHYANSANHLYLGDGGAGGNGGNGKTGAGGGGSKCATPGENGEIGGNGGNGGNGGIGGGIILIKAGSINHSNTLIKAMGSSGTAGTSATNGGVGGDGICGGGGGDGADGGNGGSGGHGGAGGAIKISKGGGAVNTSFVNVAGGSAMVGGSGGQGGLGGLNSNAFCACNPCDLSELIPFLIHPNTTVSTTSSGITTFNYQNGNLILSLIYHDSIICTGESVGVLSGTLYDMTLPINTYYFIIGSTPNNILQNLENFVNFNPPNLDSSGNILTSSSTSSYYIYRVCISCNNGSYELPENGDPGIDGPSSTPGGIGYYDEECVAPAIATISNMTICQGQSVTFYGQTLFSAGQYSHTLQSVSGCDSIVTLNLTVNPLPTISGNQTLCENTTSLLIGSGTPAITPWLSSNPGVVTISTNGIVTALSPGVTIITYTNSNGCSASYTLIVNPLIQPLFTQFGPYCNGASIPALPTTSTNGITGTWSPAINNAAPTIAVTTSYTFTPTPGVGICATTATVTIVVHPITTPLFATLGPFCQGDIPTVLPSTSNNNIAGTWSPSTISTAAVGNTTYSFTPSLTAAPTCATTATMVINISPLPTASITGTTTVCQNSAAPNITFTGAGSTPPYTFTYNIGGIGNNSISTSNSSSSVTVAVPTNTIGIFVYNLISVAVGSCVNTLSNQVATVTVNGSITPTFDPVGPFCNGASIPALPTTSTNNIVGTWAPAINNAAPTIAVTTSYTFTPNPGAGICATTATLPITVFPSFSSSSSLNICQGSSIQFNGQTLSTPGIYTQTFQSVNGCDSIVMLTLTVNPVFNSSTNLDICQGTTTQFYGQTLSTSGTYAHTLQAVNGCDSIVTLNLTVNPSAVVFAGVDQTICSNEIIYLDGAISGGAIAGLWSGGSGSYVSGNTILNPTYTPTQAELNTGILTLTLTSNDPAGPCGPEFDQVQITINQIPMVNAGPNQTICFNEVANISATLSGGATAGIWSTNGFGTFANTTSLSTTYTPNTADINLTNLLLTFTSNDPVGPCSAVSDHLILTVHPTFNSSVNLSICQGSSIQFNGQTLSTVGVYTQTFQSVVGCDSIVTLTLTVNPVFSSSSSLTICQGATTQFHGQTLSASGTYTHTLQAVNGCDSIVTLNLTVLSSSTTAFSSSIVQGNVSCQGDASGFIQLAVSGGIPSYNYLWSNGATTEDLTNLSAGSYSVLITDANGCSITNQTIITEPTSALSINGNQINVGCYGGNNGSISVIAQGGTPSYDYLWNNGQTTSTINGLSIGTYTVLVTDDLNCSSSMTFTISQPLGEMGITSTIVNTSCLNTSTGSIDLSIINGTPTYNYSWSNGATTEDINNLSSGDYTVTVTDALGCAINATITVEDPINPMIVTPTVSNLNCNGGSDAFISLAISGGASPYDILWNNGENSPLIDSLSAGNYSVMVSDGQGCQTPLSFNISQPASIVANFNPSVTSGCSPLTVTFNNTSTGPYTNYLWNFGNGSTSSAANGSFTFTQPSCYNVSLIVSNAAGCADTLSADSLICVFAGPNASFVTSSGGIDFYSGQLALLNTSDGAISDYHWSFGDGSPNSSLENPIHYYPEEQAGTYLVILSVIDTNGCVDTTSYVFSLVENLSVYVPNTITINDDNINEVFLPVFSNVDILQSYQLEIFDRWGELIWETDIVSKGWNGRYKGNKDVQIGTYTWKIQYTDNVSVSRVMLGHVNVIR